MRTPRLATVAWFVIATVVLVYAPMAFEYTARLFGGGPELWDHTFSAAVGSDHALGAGSIHHEQQGVYSAHRWVLLTHTSLGSIAIALAVFQLTNRSRRRPGAHRIVGRVQATLAVTAMLGAMTYLVLVGPRGTYDGPAFYLQLWGLAIGTLAGTVLGVLAARQRHIASHRVLMTYAFALLCTAPFLRVLYILLGMAWPGVTQEVTNLAGGAIERRAAGLRGKADHGAEAFVRRRRVAEGFCATHRLQSASTNGRSRSGWCAPYLGIRRKRIGAAGIEQDDRHRHGLFQRVHDDGNWHQRLVGVLQR